MYRNPFSNSALGSRAFWTIGFVALPPAGLAGGRSGGPVESPTAALAGGLVTGAVTSAGQWLASGRHGRHALVGYQPDKWSKMPV